jgi:hypothetical protein
MLRDKASPSRRRNAVVHDARAKIIAELASEFVEERVRQRPTEAFRIDDVKRALASLLSEAEASVELKATDDRWLCDWLDRHPFLLRADTGSALQWKPGLNRAAAQG